MLRQRPGFRLAAAFACSVVLAAPAGAPAATGAALPDSVIARLPHRDLTANEMRTSWARIDPQYRPAGTGAARNRAFLDQLLEKEAMARTALAEPFTMTERESAQYLAYAKNLERQELYQMLVGDSVFVIEADRDSARARLDSASRVNPEPPGSLDAAARHWSERRRNAEVEASIRAALAPAWDDSAVARLARGYAAADPSVPDLDKPLQARLPDRRPLIAPEDSARVLVSSTVGPLTVAEFARRFQVLNPFQTPLPVTPGAVQARGEQFLGQMWFDAEAVRRNVQARPRVAAALAERRESIALDHWYARHVAAALDTSEAALRAHFDRDPGPYAAPAHFLVTHAGMPTRAAADSLIRELAAGTPWDSVCARLPGLHDTERGYCLRTVSIAEQQSDTTLVAQLRPLPDGGAFVHHEQAAGVFRVIRRDRFVARRPRTFEEARTFVARDVATAQSEKILTERMAKAVKAQRVSVNERALERLALEP